MESQLIKSHWEKVYRNKALNNLSWYEAVPSASLNFFDRLNVSRDAKIIDIGGGASTLVDHLLNLGYHDLTVLDISEVALEKAKLRLGEHSSKVKWILADAVSFEPQEKYDFWHDRAAFHFLIKQNQISAYLKTLEKSINSGGFLLIGTFSTNGPKECSELKIKQYSEESMTDILKQSFKKINCVYIDHKTPFNTIQNFVFCSFRKTNNSILKTEEKSLRKSINTVNSIVSWTIKNFYHEEFI